MVSINATGTELPTESTIDDKYTSWEWIASQCSFCIMDVIAIYLLIATQRYLSICNEKTKPLVFICILSLVSTQICLINGHITGFVEGISDQVCAAMISVHIFIYFISYSSTFILLWYRQYCFYSDKHLKYLVNKRVLFFSKFSLFIMIVGGLTVCALMLVPQVTGWQYKVVRHRCVDASISDGLDIVSFCQVLLSFTAQTMLLGLLLYPLVHLTITTNDQQVSRNTSKEETKSESENNVESLSAENRNLKPTQVSWKENARKNFENDEETSIDTSSSSTNQNPPYFVTTRLKSLSRVSLSTKKKKVTFQKVARLKRLIRKILILTVICLLSDVAANVIQQLTNLTELSYIAIFHINLMINIICIVASFNKWTDIVLFSRCHRGSSSLETHSAAGSFKSTAVTAANLSESSTTQDSSSDLSSFKRKLSVFKNKP